MSKFNGIDDRDALVQLRTVLQFAADSYHDMASRMVGESRIAMSAMGEHYDRGVMLVDDRIEDLDAATSTPAVDLPTEPTLGWVTSKYGGSVVGMWERYESTVRSRAGEASALVRERDLPLEGVAAFTPAVAVPKAALDELREVLDDQGSPFDDVDRAAFAFLAAVDAANGGDPR